MTVVKAPWINTSKNTIVKTKKFGETHSLCGYIILGTFTLTMIVLVCQTMAHIMSL